MRLVIDIPEFIYKALKENSDCGTVNLNHIVAQGKVLPQGHGDLIDRDELFTEYPEIAVEPYINAPTVIESDKGKTKEDNPCPCIECTSTNFKRDCQYCKAWARWNLESE